MIRVVALALGVGAACAAVAAPRDPFSQPASLGDVGTPLQRVEIEQLRLVGLVYASAAARALLQDDAGIGYVAVVGTPVGPRGGAVVAIERGKLRIREPAADEDVVLELATKEQSK